MSKSTCDGWVRRLRGQRVQVTGRVVSAGNWWTHENIKNNVRKIGGSSVAKAPDQVPQLSLS